MAFTIVGHTWNGSKGYLVDPLHLEDTETESHTGEGVSKDMFLNDTVRTQMSGPSTEYLPPLSCHHLITDNWEFKKKKLV